MLSILQIIFHAVLNLRSVRANNRNSLQIRLIPHHILRIEGSKHDIEAIFDGFNALLQQLQLRLVLPPCIRLKNWSLGRFCNVGEGLYNCPQLTQL